MQKIKGMLDMCARNTNMKLLKGNLTGFHNYGRLHVSTLQVNKNCYQPVRSMLKKDRSLSMITN